MTYSTKNNKNLFNYIERIYPELTESFDEYYNFLVLFGDNSCGQHNQTYFDNVEITTGEFIDKILTVKQTKTLDFKILNYEVSLSKAGVKIGCKTISFDEFAELKKKVDNPVYGYDKGLIYTDYCENLEKYLHTLQPPTLKRITYDKHEVLYFIVDDKNSYFGNAGKEQMTWWESGQGKKVSPGVLVDTILNPVFKPQRLRFKEVGDVHLQKNTVLTDWGTISCEEFNKLAAAIAEFQKIS